MSEPFCLECTSRDNVAFYNVVRDGGDEYPWTPLCAGCADDYANDDAVDSIRPASGDPIKGLLLTDDEAMGLARLLAHAIWNAGADRELYDPIFVKIVGIFGIEGELEDLASGT